MSATRFVVLAWDEPLRQLRAAPPCRFIAPFLGAPAANGRLFTAGDTADTRITQNSNLTNGNAYHFHVFAQSQAGLWSENISSVIADSGFVPTVTATPVAAPPLSAVRNVSMAAWQPLICRRVGTSRRSWATAPPIGIIICLLFATAATVRTNKMLSTEGVTVNSHFNCAFGCGLWGIMW